jgi:hypothetical protein
MTFALKFSNAPTELHCVVEPEDVEMARQIGVLTPREIIPSDRMAAPMITETDGSNEQDDALYEQAATISWAQRASGKKPLSLQEIRDRDIADLEFLMLQAQEEGDDHEDTMADLYMDWLNDMDHICLDPTAPYGYTAGWDEVWRPSITEVVRVVAEFPRYFVGSIAGAPPSVYIPKEMFTARIVLNGPNAGQIEHGPVEEVLAEDHLHGYFLMDLEHTPGLRNEWRAQHLHRCLPTAVMHQYTHFSPGVHTAARVDELTVTDTFLVPMSPSYIGAIIGKEGKNMTSLIKRITDKAERARQDDWSDTRPRQAPTSDPEITLTPAPSGEDIIVSIARPHGCYWTAYDVLQAVRYMHC